MFDIEDVVQTAAARASREAKLKIVSIVRWYKNVYSQLDVSELKNTICAWNSYVVNNDSGGGDGGDWG